MQAVVPIMPDFLIEINSENATFILNAENTENSKAEERHQIIEDTGVTFSILYAAKALVRVLAGPLTGTTINKIGYSIPFFVGLVIMSGSAITFAFGQTYFTLLLARSVHGLGSSCVSAAGMGLIAEYYKEETERSKAIGISLGALAVGGLIGAPYGGVMYHFFGKELPFLVLGLIGILAIGLQVLILTPKVERRKMEEKEPSSVWKLLIDPYIFVALCGIFFSYYGWVSLQPALQFRMIDVWGAKTIERSVAFLPSTILYIISTNFLGVITTKIRRFPFVPRIWFFAIPFTVVGLSMGLIDTGLYFLLGHLAELRHQKAYGPVYALADSIYCLGGVIGPLPSGYFVEMIGFEYLCYSMAMVTIFSAPLMVFLRGFPEAQSKSGETNTTS
ncbi:unnamed protein product, partial [Mesorhabditis belari]|uniref:Major facilitator superfamily (MFS) profile domain-containing protein n=1 Tax=Mesorhabditis belari TaxID=2138241 RepID=A0AAF3FK06_9BILA